MVNNKINNKLSVRDNIIIKYEKCDTCEDDPIVVQSYYNGVKMYGHCYHSDTIETLNEIRNIVIDVTMGMINMEGIA